MGNKIKQIFFGVIDSGIPVDYFLVSAPNGSLTIGEILGKIGRPKPADYESVYIDGGEDDDMNYVAADLETVIEGEVVSLSIGPAGLGDDDVADA